MSVFNITNVTPAIKALENIQEPTPEHFRACIFELVKVIDKLREAHEALVHELVYSNSHS